MKPNTQPKTPRPFWLVLPALLAGIGALGYLLSLLTGLPLSTYYFFAAVFCLLVSAVPIFTEVGGNAKAGYQARRKGEAPREVIERFEKSGKYAFGTRITFLFGTAGFICFVLAVLT